MSLTRINTPIIIGVLSSGSGEGPIRRHSIRSTWGYRRTDIFFIVAGPWYDIEQEYNDYEDLLWIDKDEVYVTDTSVLTFKTESFIAVVYKHVLNYSYLLKTDDDSYVNISKLYNALLTDEPTQGTDYWGKCNDGGWKPHRNHDIRWQKKWYISYETYPEPSYPPYCQGAGFALSQNFLDCVVGDEHLARIRYMPNEDVAIGLLAERCNIKPFDDARVWIRWDESELTMEGKIIQHYVKSDVEMRGHHKNCTGVNGPIVTW